MLVGVAPEIEAFAGGSDLRHRGRNLRGAGERGGVGTCWLLQLRTRIANDTSGTPMVRYRDGRSGADCTASVDLPSRSAPGAAADVSHRGDRCGPVGHRHRALRRNAHAWFGIPDRID